MHRKTRSQRGSEETVHVAAISKCVHIMFIIIIYIIYDYMCLCRLPIEYISEQYVNCYLVGIGIRDVQRDWNMQYIKYYLLQVQLIRLKSTYYVFLLLVYIPLSKKKHTLCLFTFKYKGYKWLYIFIVISRPIRPISFDL